MVKKVEKFIFRCIKKAALLGCGFGLSIISLLRIILKMRFNNHVRKQGNKKNIVILGNGPSLETSINKHLTYFKSSDCLCVNTLCLKEYFWEIKPKYYLLVDPAYFEEKVSDNLEQIRTEMFNVLNKKCTWPLTLIFPSNAWPYIITRFNKNKNITVTFYNATPFKGFPAIRDIVYKMQIACPTAYNVLISALFLSVNMGYSTVELCGVDHSWHEDIFIDEDNRLLIVDKHFSTKENSVANIWYKDHEETQIFKLHELFKWLSDVLQEYHLMNEYAKKHNVEIVNCSEKSCIDAFNRRTFRTVSE